MSEKTDRSLPKNAKRKTIVMKTGRSMSMKKRATRRPKEEGTKILASQEGFEPPTDGLEGRCSIQLSYWDKKG